MNKHSNFQIYSSLDHDRLIDELTQAIKSEYQTKDKVFKPVPIIAASRAQFNWIKEKLAEKLGFIANLEFYTIQNLFRELIKRISQESGDTENKIWNIFNRLGQGGFVSANPKIRDYCCDDEVKKLGLAEKMAGLFEDYQEYHPELIKKWQDGSACISSPDEKWQAELYNISDFGNDFYLPEDFKNRLQENSEQLKDFDCLFMYGNLDITPLYREYLKILSQTEMIQIKAFTTNLELLNTDHLLIKKWRASLKNDFTQLGVINKIRPNKIYPATTLGNLQESMIKDSKPMVSKADDSIVIYNSFTKVREVEALYNFLVASVEESKGELAARDIAVFVPNLKDYIPAIKTVFDPARYFFPYTLVTKGFGREENFWTALEQILSFGVEDFIAPKVFGLIESKPIQLTFGFEDLDLLRKAFSDANIRRDYEGDPSLETHYTSFQYGVNRLMYGFCLGSEVAFEQNDDKILPVDIAEGTEAHDIFRLHYFVEQLKNLTDLKAQSKTVQEWQRILIKIAQDFLQPEDWREKQFENMIENLITGADSSQKIEFRTFFSRLKQRLESQDVQQTSGRGGIVFSGMYPGVGIPRKIVAYLGLNFQEYPRKSQKLSFDLLRDDIRPEQRNIDQAVFLETFLMAEDKILLSYIGQSIKDNSEIPSSSIIDELTEYLKKQDIHIKEVKHKLHAFSPVYFRENQPELYTYQGTSEPIKLLSKNKEDDQAKKPEVIQLYELENFMKDPFRHYYQKVLGIYYREDEGLPEWECFNLDNLQEWIVKDRLKDLKVGQNEMELEEIRKEFVVKSELPLRNIGNNILAEHEEIIDGLWNLFLENGSEEEINTIEDRLEFVIDGKTFTLEVSLSCMREDLLFLIVSKKDKFKYELSAYIQYLAYKALGIKGDLLYYCLDDNSAFHQKFSNSISREEVTEELKRYIKWYLDSHYGIIPFYPELGLKTKALEDCDDEIGEEKTNKIKNLIDATFGDYSNVYHSDYFINEYNLGFFEGNKGESRLLEFHQNTLEITRKVDKLFER